MRITEKLLQGYIANLAAITGRDLRYQHSNGYPRIEDHTNDCEALFIGDSNKDLYSFLQGMAKGYRIAKKG